MKDELAGSLYDLLSDEELLGMAQAGLRIAARVCEERARDMVDDASIANLSRTAELLRDGSKVAGWVRR